MKVLLKKIEMQDNRGTRRPIYYVIREWYDDPEYGRQYRYSNEMFLTEDAAEAYLKRRRYAFSKNAHTYVHYAGEYSDLGTLIELATSLEKRCEELEKRLEIAREALKWFIREDMDGDVEMDLIQNGGEKAQEAIRKIDELNGLKNETK